MITSTSWRGKRYAVLGLARSGAATVRALLASGAEVVAWDSDEGARNALSPGEGRGPAPNKESGPPPSRGNIVFADPLTLDLTGFEAVIVSPGVPLNRHPIAGHAAKYGVPVIGDIELFAQARAELPPHKVVGITGTNGKSTTTALVHHILKTAGVPTTMGGNIGLPILGQAPLPAGGVYVLELSSFQIDLTLTLDCDVAMLLNVTPDHLDRYENFWAYGDAKLRLFEMQSSRSHAVIASYIREYDAHMEDLCARLGSHAGAGSVDTCEGNIQIPDGTILSGPHNAQNIWAAQRVVAALGVESKCASKGIVTFPGLPHRMERIAEIDGVTYVNDSKATNPDSAAPALAAFPSILWLLGGIAKAENLEACAPHFGHVKTALTFGRDGHKLAALLRPHMMVAEQGDLQTAFKRASMLARPGDTVLLSPACASFDQFRNFEDRGDAFRALVEAL